MATSVASTPQQDEELPPLPPDDLELNVFLKDLADALTKEDFKALKFYLSGQGGSGLKTRESIKDPLDYFQHLRHRCLLSPNNILVLQSFIWHLGRRDLHAKLVKYAKKRGNILHFYNTSDKPVNGYEYVHFHVAGRKTMNRNKLEELRSFVSRYLFIPPEFVVVTDIAPTNSILITFMIPEGYAVLLQSIDDSDKQYLVSKDVDEMTVNDHTIKFAGCSFQSAEDNINIEMEVIRLLDDQTKTNKEMEKLHIQLINQDKTIRKLTNELKSTWKKMEVAKAVTQQFTEERFVPRAILLHDIASALRNAQITFSHTLKIAQDYGYGADLVNFIIQINTLFIRTQSRKFYAYFVAHQNIQHDIALLSYQRYKTPCHLRYLSVKQNEDLGLLLPISDENASMIDNVIGYFELENVKQIVHELHSLIDIVDSILTEKEKDAIMQKYSRSLQQELPDSKFTLLRFLHDKHVDNSYFVLLD